MPSLLEAGKFLELRWASVQLLPRLCYIFWTEMKTLQSYSSAETKKFGHDMAQSLANGKWPFDGAQGKQIANRKTAVIFALQGNLGAGKTTFTQGFYKGLGIKKRPASPTFVIMRRAKIKHPQFNNIYHIDAYRLKKDIPLEALGFKEVFSNGHNLVVVEWPENLRSALPKKIFWLKFIYGKKENERKITIRR
jgi:tRNA threonylcarbamoyladenosine biosynthesis protein TsaE